MSYRRRAAAATLLIFVAAFQIYLIRAGYLMELMRDYPALILYLAIISAIYAAVDLIVLEYFQSERLFERRARVLNIVGANLLCANFIILWITPAWLIPLTIAIFFIVDLLAVRVVLNMPSLSSQ